MSTQNPNLPSPASAGGSSTSQAQPSGGTPETGPLSRSHLATALAKAFESQNATAQPSQGAPDGRAGQGAPSPSAHAEQAPENATPGQPTEEQTDPNLEAQPGETQPAEGEQPPAEGDPAGNGEIPAEEEEEAGFNERMQKRFDQMRSKIAQLETKLAKQEATPAETRQPVAPTKPGPLDSVMDPRELDQRQSDVEAGLDEVDKALAALAVQPQGVERYLRASGIKLTDGDGNEDYSNESMLNWLSGTRSAFRATLRAIPHRRQYLADYSREHAHAVELFPWIKDKTDPKHALMQSFLSQAPSLQRAPNHEYWLGCAIRGHLATQDELAKKGKPAAGARTTPPARRPGPSTAANPTAGPRQRNDKREVARQRVLKEGSRSSLSAFIAETNIV